jgi:hypothetical protein
MDGLHNFKLDTGESGIADVDYKIVSKSEEPTGIFGTTHLNRAGHFVTG